MDRKLQAREPETGGRTNPNFGSFSSESSGPVITPLHPQALGKFWPTRPAKLCCGNLHSSSALISFSIIHCWRHADDLAHFPLPLLPVPVRRQDRWTTPFISAFLAGAHKMDKHINGGAAQSTRSFVRRRASDCGRPGIDHRDCNDFPIFPFGNSAAVELTV